jgi:dienelactone hydrolase
MDGFSDRQRRCLARARAGLALVLALAAVFGARAAMRPPPATASVAPGSAVDRIVGPYGSGAATVWLVLPTAPMHSVVVFAHGWKTLASGGPPFPGHPWVDEFRPWFDHLAAAGSAVIFPAYMLLGDAGDAMRVHDFETGIRTADAKLGRPTLPFVVCGYSFGGSLAFYYAANARSWGLPTPRAVQAIFPAGMIAAAPLPKLDGSVRVLIQVGAADTAAGSGGANRFWGWLAGHAAARKRYEVIHSTPQLPATHAAPRSSGTAARAEFWYPLDRLIAAARQGR